MSCSDVVETKLDPRVKRTRRLLVEAFFELLGEKGFDAITVQDIAARATVNRATFYAHFTDKYALVDELVREGFERILHRRLAESPDTIEAFLRQLFLAVADQWGEMQGQCRVVFRTFESLMEAQVKSQLRAHVRARLSDDEATRGRGRERLDMMTAIVTWSLYGAAMEWVQGWKRLRAETYAERVLPLLVAAISAG